MNTSDWLHLALTAVGWIVVIVRVEQKQKDQGDRIERLELAQRDMAKDYVPRPEVQAQLDAIQRSITDVKGLLQVSVYAGRGMHAAAVLER